MNSLTRTLDFISGKETDHVPFHPILMRFAAKYAGIRYRKFCLEAESKCTANMLCARDFKSDWVNTMSDPWAESEAYGTLLDYPEDDLPRVKKYAVQEISDIDRLKALKTSENARMAERLKEIETYRQSARETMFICGWVEGPLAEYCDIRDINMAMTDLYEYPAELHKALDIITGNAIDFITDQVNAGAHCIGIGDSVCSLISPDLYREFCFSREKTLVDHIHSCGALAKIHICGNIGAILNDVILTGADIVDIDHRVISVTDAVPLLAPSQVMSGKGDPVTVIQDGDSKMISDSVWQFYKEAGRRAIVSAGCEVTPGTSRENMHSFSSAARELK